MNESIKPFDHEVAWISHKTGDKCSCCDAEIISGDLIQANAKDGLRCVRCAGYTDLCFLPAGDPKLTRLATSLSSRVVVVVKWSRARKRHERQGILVDERAYGAAVEQAEADATARPKSRPFRVIEMDGEKLLWKQP
jgi:hypothetical protein